MKSSTAWKSLLVVVGDITHRPQMALAKAAAIAMRCDAKLTLLHTFAFPYPMPLASDVMSSQMIIETAIKIRLEFLEKLARKLRRKQLVVECVVEWDFPPHEAVVRYVRKHQPDLVIVESQRHSKLGRWLLANTDWELIRACPVPLWFVKTARLPQSLTLLAAVDPMHAHAKPSGLDDRILNFAQQIKRQLNGEVSMVHAYEEPVIYSPDMTMEPITIPMLKNASHSVSAVRKKMAQLAKQHHLAKKAVVTIGDPASVLPTIAKQRSANAVIMGAVSRRGLTRAFIGNTAEKVIDHLNCDVVIVKPADFKTAVPTRRVSLRKF